jgi:Domain of unknown function (DUF4260)
MDDTDQKAGAATGGIRILLRLEGVALGLVALALYAKNVNAGTGASWWLFAALILAPDLSFLGYLGGQRIGAAAYNTLHSTLLPILLGITGVTMAPNLLLTPIALIWLAHIGIDRALGYGLKYQRGFGFTHLGRIGKDAATG